MPYHFIQKLEKCPTSEFNLQAEGKGENLQKAFESVIHFDNHSPERSAKLPETLQKLSQLAQENKLVAHQVQISVEPDWLDSIRARLPNSKPTTFYILAEAKQICEIADFIQTEAADHPNNGEPPTEMRSAAFASDLEKRHLPASNIGGWLDHRGKYFIFVDQAMYENVKQVLGIPHPNRAKPCPPSPVAALA